MAKLKITSEWWTSPNEAENGKLIIVTGRKDMEAVKATGKFVNRIEVTWTYEPDATTGDVEFGGDVRIKVDAETGKTNSVSFAAVAFKPGATCTFTLNGFEASAQDITDLQMWLVVCEMLGGTPWRVPVSKTARFDAATGALTVTLPPEATLKKPDGEPYSSFFILGIDNKDTAE